MATLAANGGGGGARPGVAPGRQKQSEWTGVRPRQGGRWAAEIRVPNTREKLWIGTFESPRLAALAYDAAVFCFYGERLPKTRRLNFPVAPTPELPGIVRARLTVGNVKAIAEQHARTVDALLPPPGFAAAAPLVVAAAAPVEAAPATYHGVPTAMADNNLVAGAADDSQFSFDADVIAGLMGLVPGEY
ncbi:ethylene-responsive transcription factor ERF011 [Setaria italica]|nr:ethylene-responsive transcription factor ERF011 [Setaria italica]